MAGERRLPGAQAEKCLFLIARTPKSEALLPDADGKRCMEKGNSRTYCRLTFLNAASATRDVVHVYIRGRLMLQDFVEDEKVDLDRN